MPIKNFGSFFEEKMSYLLSFVIGGGSRKGVVKGVRGVRGLRSVRGGFRRGVVRPAAKVNSGSRVVVRRRVVRKGNYVV